MVVLFDSFAQPKGHLVAPFSLFFVLKKMRVGSWYLSEDGKALGEYSHTVDKRDVFACLSFDAKKNALSRLDQKAFTPCMTMMQEPARRTIWTKEPMRQRIFVKGDPVLVLTTGAYTVLPRMYEFVRYLNDGHHMCEVLRTEIDDIWQVNVRRLRNAKYLECETNCRSATLCWMLVSNRLGLYKDVRRLIGELVWESRDEREWETKHSTGAEKKRHKK